MKCLLLFGESEVHNLRRCLRCVSNTHGCIPEHVNKSDFRNPAFISVMSEKIHDQLELSHQTRNNTAGTRLESECHLRLLVDTSQSGNIIIQVHVFPDSLILCPVRSNNFT